MVAINSTWMLAVKGVVSETTHIHTLHFLAKSDAATAANLIDSWRNGPSVQYRALFGADDLCVGMVSSTNVCGSLPLLAGADQTVTGLNSVGSRPAGGVKEPAFMACCVTERTANQGKSYRGRFFIGGLFDSDVDRNTLVGGYITTVQAYADALLALYGPAGTNPHWNLFVHSRTLAAAGGQCQDFGGLVTSLSVNGRPTTMRSRKYGHGT